MLCFLQYYYSFYFFFFFYLRRSFVSYFLSKFCPFRKTRFFFLKLIYFYVIFYINIILLRLIMSTTPTTPSSVLNSRVRGNRMKFSEKDQTLISKALAIIWIKTNKKVESCLFERNKATVCC